MKIRELLDRDPLQTPLANSGQARLASGDDDKIVEELRAELTTFVCEGQFADALQRILEGYLANLDRSRQDSVWVSGFFGSGKSHLLKMLAHLWTNTEFADGATARGLVPGGLPSGVEAALRELDVRVTRTGMPAIAAAGSLLGGNVDHVRLAVLSVLLEACGWPTQYPQAKFCFWLREEGLLDPVRGAVEDAGRDWARELNYLYVSPVLAKALIAAKPDFAAEVRAALQLLASQFPPPKTDITEEQFVEAAKQALAPDGKIPLTILVLDEVQQYINEVQDRSGTITDLAEALQTQFGSRILLVAAGQSALAAGTKALQWLSDRFRVSVQLSDAEVEVVTRHVLLHKKPSALPVVGELLEKHAGEVSRHLQGTRLAVRAADRDDGPGDYPLLRTRRRFWEACFQAADQAGTQSQLRSQLRILHDSLQGVADRELGAVIPASDLFHAVAPDLVNSGVLLNEINTRIGQLDDGSDDGVLRRDLCGVAFLIGKLPREGGADLGVRADATTLADLLVEDVSRDSGPFRNRVAEALEDLAGEGVLMKVGTEYRLQTTAGAEWERAFRERRTTLSRQEVDIARHREQVLHGTVQGVVSRLRPVHGEATLRRKPALHANSDPDSGDVDSIRIWLRDEWSCSWKDVESEARERGMEDAILHVYLPKRSADALRSHIVDAEAARHVLDRRGVPDSPEGREACESMRSRLAAAESARDGIVREIVRAARVLQGGGGELHGEDLLGRLEAGADASLARLFPRFPDGDHRAWRVALKRAREGSDQPFVVVGWNDSVAEHPVAREVLDTVGAGARGSAVRKKLMSTPYGWPQDAIDAALVALHGRDHLTAARNGRTMQTAELDQTAITTTEFRPEKIRLTAAQRTAIRGLYRKADLQAKSGEEVARAAEFIGKLRELASQAGGSAPLPAAPLPPWLDELGRLTGNEQLLGIYEAKDEIGSAVADWKEREQRANERSPQWEMATALSRHAADHLDIANEVEAELDAVHAQRSLLDDTDHVSPCVAKLADALRAALTKLHGELAQAVEAETRRLADDAIWARLDTEAQTDILRQVGLSAPTSLSLPNNEALTQALNHRSLSAWESEIDAVSHRATKALAEAAAGLRPGEPTATSVSVRRGTLEDESAVHVWLDEHKRKLTEAVKNGPVIVE